MSLNHLLVFLISNALFCPTAWSKALKFDDTTYNFGEVIRGEILSWQVNFENISKQDVRIQGVYSGCGCAAIELSRDQVYRPGDTGSILVKFDTSNFVGSVSKQVVVITSEKQRAQTTLKVNAKIKEEFVLSPVLLDFGVLDGEKVASKEFSYEGANGFKFELKDIEYNKDLFDIYYTPGQEKGTVKLSLKAGGPTGFIKETLYVHTNSDALPRVKVPVRAEVIAKITSRPSYLEFGAIAEGRKSKNKLNLTAKTNFSILSSRVELHVNNRFVKDASEMVTVSFSAKPSSDKDVEIVILNPNGLTGSVHGSIYLESSLDSANQIKADFYAFFK